MTTPPETPTPRTDAKSKENWIPPVIECVPADFARQLERENITFRNAQKACEDCDGPTMEKVRKMEQELAEANHKSHQLNFDIVEIRRRHAQEAKEWKSDEELIADRDRWHKMAECAIHALRCANNSFVGSPEGQKQIDDALNRFTTMQKENEK